MAQPQVADTTKQPTLCPAYELAIAMVPGLAVRVPKRPLSTKHEAIMALSGSAHEKDLGELHGDIELEKRIMKLLDNELRTRGATISSSNYEMAKTAILNNIYLAYVSKEYGLTTPEFQPIKVLTKKVKEAGDAFETYVWLMFKDGIAQGNVVKVVEWIGEAFGPTISALLDLLQDRP